MRNHMWLIGLWVKGALRSAKPINIQVGEFKRLQTSNKSHLEKMDGGI